MTQKFPAWLAIMGLLIGLLVACQDQAPTGGQADSSGATGKSDTGTKSQPDMNLKVPESIPQQSGAAAKPAGSPAPKSAASPAAKTAASPQTAPQNIVPQGQVTYIWHTSISPQWFDPQENPQQLTPYGWQYMMHDALVKHMPGKPLSPSLAESYQIAPDFRSATFKLRPNLTFHNGEALTSEDVKYTFENYRGTNATVLHEKTASIETPDDLTIKFNFSEPFLDFEILYGSPASGAGWIVPKDYYEQVGPDGFKQNPIGAGPYKVVRQVPGSEVELEAFEDYWRHPPYVKTLLVRGISEGATRVASFQAGEADFINLIPGQLVETVRPDPKLQLAPVKSGTFWIEPLGVDDPNSPLSDPKVREAISLALDRQAISEAEEAGLSTLEGNWIPANWPGAIQRPTPEYNPERARQLLAEAGYADGLDIGQVTPLPNYFSLAERVISQLRQIGITASLNQMERGAFLQKLAEGPGAYPSGLVIQGSASPGDAASRIRAFASCGGANSRMCIPEIEEPFQAYNNSTDPKEREQLIAQVQEYILDNYVMIPIYRQAFINGQGPRIANAWDEVIGAIPQYVYVGPYEDIQLKP